MLSSLLLSFLWLIVIFVVIVVVVIIILVILVVDCCHCCCSFVAAVVVLVVGEEAFGFEFNGLAILVIYMVVKIFFTARHNFDRDVLGTEKSSATS